MNQCCRERQELAACALPRWPRVGSGSALCLAFTKEVPNEFKSIPNMLSAVPRVSLTGVRGGIFGSGETLQRHLAIRSEKTVEFCQNVCEIYLSAACQCYLLFLKAYLWLFLCVTQIPCFTRKDQSQTQTDKANAYWGEHSHHLLSFTLFAFLSKFPLHFSLQIPATPVGKEWNRSTCFPQQGKGKG